MDADDAQTAQLRATIAASHKYGREIERSVLELSEMLRSKTIECDRLRALSAKHNDGLRVAVLEEQKKKSATEARHAETLKALHATLQQTTSERNRLRAEVEELRRVVRNVDGIPPTAEQAASLFDRIAGTAEASTWGGAPLRRKIEDKHHRELVSFLTTMPEDKALSLRQGGFFVFIRVLLGRVAAAEASGSPMDLGSIVAGIVRDMRQGLDFRAELLHGLTPIETSWRQQAIDLYRANEPTPRDEELVKLFEEYLGREKELVEMLQRVYSSGSHLQSHVAAPMRESAASPSLADTAVELRARIVLMYQKYAPQKLMGDELQELMQIYSPDVLLNALVQKYGPEPNPAERRNLLRNSQS